MANSYKIAYPKDGATVTGRLYRGTSLIETVTPLDEDAGDYLNVYSKASGETWQPGDDIVYYDGATVIGAETYQPESTPVGGSSELILPAGYVGDYLDNETLYIFWRTIQPSTTDGTIKVYRDGGATEVTAPTGILADTRHFDPGDLGANSNIHMVQLDLSVNSFYAKEQDYAVVINGIVIDGVTQNAVIATFSIENRYAGKQFIRDG